MMIELWDPEWRDAKIWQTKLAFDCSCANCANYALCKKHDDLCEHWLPSLAHFSDFRAALKSEIDKLKASKREEDARFAPLLKIEEARWGNLLGKQRRRASAKAEKEKEKHEDRQ